MGLDLGEWNQRHALLELAMSQKLSTHMLIFNDHTVQAAASARF